MSDDRHDDDQTEHNQARAAQTGQKQTEASADVPLNGGEHLESGSFTGTRENGVDYDGAFTDSDIPDDGTEPGETEADRAGVEGGYVDGEGSE